MNEGPAKPAGMGDSMFVDNPEDEEELRSTAEQVRTNDLWKFYVGYRSLFIGDHPCTKPAFKWTDLHRRRNWKTSSALYWTKPPRFTSWSVSCRTDTRTSVPTGPCWKVIYVMAQVLQDLQSNHLFAACIPIFFESLNPKTYQNHPAGALASIARAVSDLESSCKNMEGEYDKLINLKTKGDLQGFDKTLVFPYSFEAALIDFNNSRRSLRIGAIEDHDRQFATSKDQRWTKENDPRCHLCVPHLAIYRHACSSKVFSQTCTKALLFVNALDLLQQVFCSVGYGSESKVTGQDWRFAYQPLHVKN